MRVNVVDKVEITGTRRTENGYLVADAKVARTGIYLYAGKDVGKPDMPVVRVMRDEAVVFADASMASFAHKPITLGHPSVDVNAENWKDYARGYIGDTVKRDGDFVRVPMMVTDAAAIKRVEDGESQLSAGYSADLADEAGVNDKGEAFDMKMTGIIAANHVAIVKSGRAGSACRIGDSWDGFSDGLSDEGTKTVALKMIMVDGFQVEVTDAAEAAIVTLKGKLADAAKVIETAQATIADNVKALEAKDAEIVTLKDAVEKSKVTPDQLRDAARAYAGTVTLAKRLAPDVKLTDSMSAAEIQRAVINKRLGDKAKDWTDDQVAAGFATLAPANGGSSATLADALGDGVFDDTGFDDQGLEDDAGIKAWNDANKAMENAWKGTTATA